MNLDQLLSKVEGLKTVLTQKLQTEVETIAQDGLVLVTQRISETGINAQGGKFKPYTPAYERFKRGAVGTAKREGADKRAARKTASASSDNPVGRFTGFRNFTLSGQMLSSTGLGQGPEDRFKNIGVTSSTADRGRITVIVGPRDEFTGKKMEGNENVTPGWNHLSEKEIRTIAGYSRERLTEFALQFIGG